MHKKSGISGLIALMLGIAKVVILLVLDGLAVNLHSWN